MKKLLLIVLICSGTVAQAQRVVPVYGLEGGFLFGGLTNMSGYDGSWLFNGSFWVDLIKTNKFDKPTWGVKIKLNYNFYQMGASGNNSGTISIGETTIPILFKLCVASSTQLYEKGSGEDKQFFVMKRDLFFFVGPQIGFLSLSGGPGLSYYKSDYSYVAGGELYLNSRVYFTLYAQRGASKIYATEGFSDVRLNGFTAGIGFRLL